jgi:hypothetical protein
MFLKGKAFGKKVLDILRTCIYFVQFITGIAKKMMVMLVTSQFPTGRLPGQFD